MALTNKTCIKIGTNEYHPSSISLSYKSIKGADSGVSDAGVTHTVWVKSNIPVLSISFAKMTTDELNKLLLDVQGKTYSMIWYNPYTKTEATTQFQTGSTKGSVYYAVVDANGIYTGVSFTAEGTGA